MNTEQIIMCVVALLLGMLLANMLQNVCGCKNIVEGQGACEPLPPFESLTAQCTEVGGGAQQSAPACAAGGGVMCGWAPAEPAGPPTTTEIEEGDAYKSVMVNISGASIADYKLGNQMCSCAATADLPDMAPTDAANIIVALSGACAMVPNNCSAVDLGVSMSQQLADSYVELAAAAGDPAAAAAATKSAAAVKNLVLPLVRSRADGEGPTTACTKGKHQKAITSKRACVSHAATSNGAGCIWRTIGGEPTCARAYASSGTQGPEH